MKFPPLAMPFDDDGETAGQSTSDARDSDMSVLALAALNKLSSGVAVIGPRNRILFRNPRFVEFFDEDEWAEKIRPLIAGVADGAGVREVALPDGRTFNVEISPHPQGRLIVVEDISRRVAQCARDALQAQIDPVTLLGNAPMFRERLTAMLANMGPARQTACVLVVELVGFNAVTPSLGDPLLCIVAGRLVSALGGGGCAARLGGERFAILQAGQPQPQSAAVLAKRIIDLIGRSYLVDGHLLNIGACVGIALIPNDGETYEEILKNASLALDRAQQQGRVAYRFFKTAMERQSRERRSLELDLRSALALREFGLVYQPQLNIAQGRITGFEALLRWRNPKGGLVSPGEFIPLAEEIGLIVPIGEWVLRAACKEAAGWPNELGVGVNVSALQFASANLVPTILSALAESGLDPHRLELEITESVMLGDKRAALEVLHTVRAMGLRVSMDDFGTGYSSLSSLRSFTFDKIKIDQSFVRGDADDPSGVAIVRAVAALGRSLGMSTMAEGVETHEQFARIVREGCTDVQGYLISRPLPPEKIAEFLRIPIEDVIRPSIAAEKIAGDASCEVLPS